MLRGNTSTTLVSTAMDKNQNTNPMGTVVQTTVGADPKGARPAGLPAPPPGGGLPNPIVILRRTLAHWPVTVVVMVMGVLATAQLIRARKPIFKSETVIFYRPSVLNGDAATPLDVLRSLGAKLKETLLAQSNLKKVLDDTHLYKDIVAKRGYSEAVDLFRKNIEFKARSNDTFGIAFGGSTADEAQVVTARLASMIVEENAKSRQERAKDTTVFLEAEKKRVDEDLAKLETTLAQFMADHPEFVTDSGGRAGAAVRAEQKKVGAAAAERLNARRRALGAAGVSVGGGRIGVPIPGFPLPIGGPPVDPVLLAIRSQAMVELIASKKELGDKSLRFTEQHPDVRAAVTRAAAAELALQKAEDDIRAATPPPPPPPSMVADTPENPYDDAAKVAARPSAVGGSPDDAKPKEQEKAPESTLVTLETEWNRINREVGKVRLQQAQLETRVFQAATAESAENGGYSATIEILDEAFKPAGPSGAPNRTIIMGGFLASLVVGIVLSAARGMLLDDRLFDASEVDGLGLVPVLGIVPRQKVEKKAKIQVKDAPSGEALPRPKAGGARG